MSDRLKELEKELLIEKQKNKKIFLKEVYKNTGFKIGDIVEYIREEREGDYDYNYEWENREIVDFDGYNGIIWISLKGLHEEIKSINCKIYNENDYTLRHQHWYREMDLGNKFQLIVDKPKSTKGKIYTVFKIIKEQGENIEYWYYNDYNHPTPIYENEFNVISKN